MTPPYEPARARQLRILLWVVIAAAAVLAVVAAGYLLAGAAPGLVLLVLVVPAVLMLVLGRTSLQLLGRGEPGAKSWIVATAVTTMLVALLLSRTGPGGFLGLLGVLLMLVALLPARDG
ncbi:hypothetical protein [Nocardioides ungokensis]|uniref:hypothetical protein n=1 Tax=Nocardioides ungokensis TaxID=1643322 RepID=UPI0015DF0CDF|nr:hypothetical protein [Nocardioides ungokensis]